MDSTTDRTEVASAQPTDVQASEAAGAAATRENEATLSPAVDIFEDEQGITLLAEMPGVSKDRLQVHADRNGLVIEGDVSIDLRAGMEALYADVYATRYRRSFTLSSELDPDRIEARLKDGVLTLRVPKRAEFRPRRIEVQGE